MLTILSTDERRQATVTETEDGAEISYYRLVVDDARGLPKGEPRPGRWRYLRTARARLPFHAACDLAVAIVEKGDARQF